MKSLKKLSLGLLAGSLVSGSAYAAPTPIHVTGSSAFRPGAIAGIIDVLSVNNTVKVYAGYSGTSLLGSGAAIIANGTLTETVNGVTTPGTATIIVQTYFTGSLAGVVDLVVGNSVGSYLDPSSNTTAVAIDAAGTVSSTNDYGFGAGSGATAVPPGGAALSGAATVGGAPDLAFSDSFNTTIQSELATGTLTAQIGTYKTIGSLATAVGGSTVVSAGGSSSTTGAAYAGFVGIVPFVWVTGSGTPDVSNISQQAAFSLIKTGSVPQSYLSGSASDAANYFYLAGRNEDSGTRIGALAESKFGVTNSPIEYSVTATKATTGPAFTVTEYPVTSLATESNIVWPTIGHSGYSSGGGVSGAVANTGGAVGTATGDVNFTDSSNASENTGSAFFLGYIGIYDANSALTAKTATALSYAGVPYSVGAVQNGQYTFWTYEHAYRLSGLSGTSLTSVNSIADEVYNTDADINGYTGTHDNLPGSSTASGILDTPTSPVLVYRTVEGGQISNY